LHNKNKKLMKKTFYKIMVTALTVLTFGAKAQVISTFAGNSAIGGTHAGDGGPATAAGFDFPAGIAMDAAGNIYIADRDNHAVRKVNTSGTISIIAGTGTSGSIGDGGAATAAQVSQPVGLNFDAAGNLYIADYGNHRIRMINSAGIISTVAGSTGGYAGDGGAATTARLSYPTDMAFDAAGNMYISDYNNGVVRKVNTSGIISTYAGGGSSYVNGIPATDASLWANNGVRVDAAGNVYITDMYHHRICKVTTAGLCYTIAGDGTAGYTGDGAAATAARVNSPAFMEFDKAGNLFFSDHSNHVIRKIDASGIITTVAGNNTSGNTGDGGAATAASISYPAGLCFSATGDLYFPAQGYHVVKKVTAAPITISGTTTICVGATTTLTGSVPSAIWSSGGTSTASVNPTTGVVTGLSAGTVNISYTKGLGFGYTTLTVDPCPTAVSTIEQLTAPKIYPNPSTGSFTFDLPATANQVTVTILDILGKEITTKTANNTQQVNFNVGNIPTGNYVVKIDTGDKTYRTKITVVR